MRRLLGRPASLALAAMLVLLTGDQAFAQQLGRVGGLGEALSLSSTDKVLCYANEQLKLCPPAQILSAGTVAGRTPATRAQDVINVLDAPYGADNKGAISAGAALSGAIAAAAALPSGGTVDLPAGTYLVNTALASIVAQGRVTLRGAGKGRTVILCDDTAGSLLDGCLTNYNTATPGPIADFHVSGITFRGKRDSNATLGHHLVHLGSCSNCSVRDSEFAFSRFMSVIFQQSQNVVVTGNSVHDGMRDGIAVWSTNNALVQGNVIQRLADDAISAHSEDGTPAPVRGGIIIADNIAEDTKGIRVLGAKIASVHGNIVRRPLGFGIQVAAGVGGFAQGHTTQHNISVHHNLIQDVTPVGFGDGDLSQVYIDVGGAPPQDPPTPGQPQSGTGTVSPLYGTGTGNFYVQGLSAANPGSAWITVESNVMTRTLPAVANRSAWGYGPSPSSVGGITYDGPMTETMLRTDCIHLSSGLRNAVVRGNTCQTTGTNAILLTGRADSTIKDMDYDGLVIRENTLIDYATGGVVLAYGSSSVPTQQRITVQGNTFDADPQFRSPYRGAGGTWTGGSVPVGVFAPFGSGLRITGNSFRNLSLPVYATNAAVLDVAGNTIFGAPVTAGPSTANRGVYDIGTEGAEYTHVIEGSDPTAPATLGVMLSSPLRSATTQPTSGTYVTGAFVRNSAPVVTGGRVLQGWQRLTTGAGHVAGTDWTPLYAAAM